MPFHHLLLGALGEGFTGTLTLRCMKSGKLVEKRLFFLGGEPTHVTSNQVSECLGRLLLRAKKITKEAYQESLAQLKNSNKLQGDILIDMGAISPEERDLALRWQTELKILDVFGWMEGQFAFSSDTPVKRRVVSLNVVDLIYRGLSEHIDPDALKAKAEELMDMTVFPVENSAANPNYVKFPKPERRVFEKLFDPPKRLREIFPISTVLPARTFRFIWVLHMMGAVTFQEVTKEAGAELLEESNLRTRVRKSYKLNHFEILEVHEISDTEGVKRGYARMESIFGPKSVVGLKPEVQELAAKYLELCVKARDALLDTQARQRYRLETCGESRCRTFSNLQMSKGEGELFLKQDYKEGIALFGSAVEIFPPNVEARALYGLALFLSAYPGNREIARKGMEQIQAAVKGGGRLSRTHVCLGIAYRVMKKREDAARAFKAAIQANPGNAEAHHLLSTLDRKLGEKF